MSRGTPCPTAEPVHRALIKASHDGQTRLGIAIFEMGEKHRQGDGRPVEHVFDPSGAARLMQVSPEEEDRRNHFQMNEQTPAFLTADPPAAQGEARFQVEFGIDGNKRLLVTATDLTTNKIVYKEHPVVKLS